MEFKTLVFYVFATILVLAALGVITARNPVHSALFLVLAFISASGIWLLLEAEFLAIVLVLIYVGAVMVLFLFVLMMLDIDLKRLRQQFWRYLPLGVLAGVLLAVEMSLVVSGFWFGNEAMPQPAAAAAEYSNTRDIGMLLYTEYAYPFELAALILLIAMIAAVSLTLRRRSGVKRVNPHDQVRVKKADRIRLVDMPKKAVTPAASDESE